MAEAILGQEIGYLLLFGFSAVFAVAVTVMVRAERKYLGIDETSEWFSTAGRSIKTGLIAAAVTSAWTWPAGIMVSATIAFKFGVSGPLWYAAGAAIQVLLFGIMAIELKRKAPNAHTYLELIKVRYGKNAHRVFLTFALMANMIVTAMLLFGGAATIQLLTGVDILLAAFIIPIGLMIYTLAGGLKATFIADYLNVAIIYISVVFVVFFVYMFSETTGGVMGLFEGLQQAAISHPVEGNHLGSYLTLASIGGLIFGIINIVGNFGVVWVDQSYWQRAIGARPSASVKGFLVGGLAWFAWPFAMATTLGLTMVAFYPDFLTPQEVDLGLVPPAVLSLLMGDVGAIIILTMIFMALTSTGCAELIAVSSIFTYDIYRTYRKPNATGKELLRVARIVILAFGIGMGGLAVLLLASGLTLVYVYLAMGVLIGSAIFPISMTLLWKKTTGTAAVLGVLVGLAMGLIAWLGTAQMMFGEITLVSTGQDFPLLWGNLAAIFGGGIITLIASSINPSNFDWRRFKEEITLVEKHAIEYLDPRETDERTLRKAFRYSVWSGGIMTIVLVIAWPLPLYLSGYIFSAEFWIGWSVLAIVWALFGAFAVVLLPIIESRIGIRTVLAGMIRSGTTPITTEGGTSDSVHKKLDSTPGDVNPTKRADTDSGENTKP
jgi:SSS family transporter